MDKVAEEKVAEIVASNIKQFKAQVLYNEAHSQTNVPAFGSWVMIPRPDGSAVLGLVFQVEAESVEPNRQVEAYNMSKEQLQREMPQVFELIRTYIQGLVLAFRDPQGKVRQTLPSHPAELHDFVYPCDDETIRQLSEPFDYLRTLINSRDAGVPTDELLVAVLQNMKAAQETKTEAKKALIQAGRTLSRLVGDDHERLKSILRRVE
jgi:hypothetical protein